MFGGIYRAASGLEAYTKNQEIIASNLANANTVGFKKNIIDFQAVLEEINGVKESKSISGDVSIDFSNGNLDHTGGSLDVAIVGEGFLAVETEDGTRYTRNGRFQLTGEGEIITMSGGRVLGTGGPLLIPPNAVEIKIDSTGVVAADGTVIDNLLITKFERRDLLVPTGDSLYIAPLNAEQSEALDSNIRQGYLERSNVDVLTEMVNMIQNMRSYEASNRIVKVFGDTLKQLIQSQA